MKREIRGQKKLLLDIIKRKGEVSLKELRESTDVHYNTIRSGLIGLTNENRIERVGRGKYKIKK